MKEYSLRLLLNVTGILSLIIAVAGIVLPLVPSVPLVLLAASCFARSSPGFYSWLHNHGYFGPLLKQFNTGNGIPKSTRNRALAIAWGSLLISTLIINKLWAGILLLTIGTVITFYLCSITQRI